MLDQNTVIDVAPGLRRLKEKYPDDNPEIWAQMQGEAIRWTARICSDGDLMDGESGWGDTMEEAVTDCIRRAGERDAVLMAQKQLLEVEAKKAELETKIANLKGRRHE